MNNTKTVHFVYALPFNKKDLSTYWNYFAKKSKLVEPVYRNGRGINWSYPIRAPFSITFNLLKALQSVVNVKLYDWTEHVVCRMEKDDILLGHPRPDFFQGEWTQPEIGSVFYETSKKYTNNQKFVLTPYNDDLRQNGWLKEVFPFAPNFIAICGDFWANTWNQSPLRKYVTSFSHINMAVKGSDYPWVRKSFHAKNHRNFLYIGRTEHPKNTIQLEKIANAVPNFTGGYISPGKIQGWTKICEYTELTPSFMSKLAEEYDVFLHPSEFDAQATIVLEMMLLGFPIACTQESGIDYPTVFRLLTQDTEYNKNQIEKIQKTETGELEKIARANRETALEKHNWKVFTDEVLKKIGLI